MSFEKEALGAVGDLGSTFGEFKISQTGGIPVHLQEELGRAFRHVNSIEPIGLTTDLGLGEGRGH